MAECDDGFLHDHLTFAVTEADVWAALDDATDAPVEEGCVGAGTGMPLFSFKGGIGSSSRVVAIDAGTFTVGVLVETNFGARPQLTVAGARVGRVITDLMPEAPTADGSCIVIVATDAPLHAHTLRRHGPSAPGWGWRALDRLPAMAAAKSSWRSRRPAHPLSRARWPAEDHHV